MATRRSSNELPDRRLFLFVHQDPSTFSVVEPRALANEARRRLASRRHEDQQAIARQRAVYARSLVGWRSLQRMSRARPLLPAPTASIEAQVQDEPERISPEVSGGLRVDPFDSLPILPTPGVMEVTDYFIHVWTKLKATEIDTVLGYNTYRQICWPLGLQDDMLFDAIMAVSRGAWCLIKRSNPEEDAFLLDHRGAALMKLRNRLSSGQVDENVLFAMDFMINIAYMAGDKSAFDIHWTAFKRAGDTFVATRTDEVATVVAHRLRSWESLDAYRKGTDCLDHTSQVQLTYVYHQAQYLSLPFSGFSELVVMGSMCLEVVDVLSKLSLVLSSMSQLAPQITIRLMEILSCQQLTKLESQICHALFALSIYFASNGSNGTAELERLDTIARAFINKKLSYATDLERRCLIWCSLVLGNVLLALDPAPAHAANIIPGIGAAATTTTTTTGSIAQTQQQAQNQFRARQRLRGKGHVILVAVAQELLQQQDTSWEALHTDDLLNQFPCTPALLTQWRRSWEATMARQREWEARGALQVGKPLGVCVRGRRGGGNVVGKDLKTAEAEADVEVEYLVLREARESLPWMMQIAS